MTSPDNAGIPDTEDVGGWAGQYGPLAQLGKFGQYLIMRPLDRLLSGLLGVPAGSFDTVEELVANLIPTIIRKVLGDLGKIFGGQTSEAGGATASDLLGKIPGVSDVAKAIQGIGTGLTGPLSTAAASVANLQDRTQALEGVKGYAQYYLSQTYQPGTSYTRVPFDIQVGPSLGVTFDNGVMTLGSKGLWQAQAQLQFDYLTGPVSKRIYIQIAVMTPAGAGYVVRNASVETNDNAETLLSQFRFVVPAAGYKVEVRAAVGTGYRSVLSGINTTGFDMLKISSETS